MNPLLWSALGLGFLGSLHCIGMCGPIVLALPVDAQSRLKLAFGRLLYNGGRILTYMLLGTLCGLAGQIVAIAGFQKGVSIVAGLLILVAVLFPKRLAAFLLRFRVADRLTHKFKTFWGGLFGRHSYRSLFVIGLLNGLLPCGLLYVALAAAAATSEPLSGVAYMALFGLGTLPVMLTSSLLGAAVPVRVRSAILRLVPAGYAVLALLLILRGLSLGIPYVSPTLDPPPPGQPTSAVHDCCK